MLIKNLLKNLRNDSAAKNILFVDAKGRRDIRRCRVVPQKGHFILIHGLIPGNIASVIFYPWMSCSGIDETVDILVNIK